MIETTTNRTSRVLAASLIGTAVEFYDFYIYATAASLVFGPLFFPASSPSAQLLAAYASFGLAFIARPVGAAVFGHFGDRIGRKSTLVTSLLLMGGSTTAIAFLPTFASAGWIAPALLCLLRIGQGLGLGGEWGGAALLAVENAPPGWSGRFGMVPQLGAPLGFIIANGLFLLLGLMLTPEQFRDWGWRLPFLASALLVAVGLWVRIKLTETPVFAAVIASGTAERAPLSAVMRQHFTPALAGMFSVIACFALYYVATAFALGYGTTTLGFARADFLRVQLGAIVFMAIGIIAAGILSDRFSPRAVLIAGCIGTIGVGAVLAPMLTSNSLQVVFAFLAGALLAMGFVYGPLGAWLPSLFPPAVRYTGVSIAFNVGGVIGGGLTPLAAQAIAEHYGLAAVGFYLSAAAGLSLVALLCAQRPARH